MKKLLIILTAVCILSCTSCTEKRILHCDSCNTQIKVKASSDMDEDWYIYCKTCNRELFGDDPVLGSE